ncbi:MAG: ATP-binding cassette domain-containing protein [Spirochaetes bacterium]|nr:ATP-binding cassette domain-containing protein [Spirochaetota bacterium]
MNRDQKIVYLIPGSGGAFYCENCLRDRPLVRALRNAGAQVMIVPLYMPLFNDGERLEGEELLVCGAVSMSLRSKIPWLRRHAPFISRILDTHPFLKIAAHLSASTRSRGLEKMTLQMMSGSLLMQQEEKEHFHGLLDNYSPDTILLSNALLIGLGSDLVKRYPAARLVCFLQDEHTWLDSMRAPWRHTAWELLKSQSRMVDLFLPVSNYYRDYMLNRLPLAQEKLPVLYPAIDVPACPVTATVTSDAPVIGYLSRICEDGAPHKLVEAWLTLKKRYKNLRLRIGGGYNGDDRPYVLRLRRILAPHITTGEVELYPNITSSQRDSFFEGMTLLCVPQKEPTAFGYYLLEAMARGIPVVEPDIGAFSEIIGDTDRSGLLYTPQNVSALTDALDTLLGDPAYAQKLSEAARKRAGTNFSHNTAAEKLLTLVKPLHNKRRRVLEINDLHRSFKNRDGLVLADVLKGVSFKIDEGECVALCGPSGSGKTTLLMLCALLDRPDNGSVTFLRDDTAAWTAEQCDRFRATELGIVFQEHLLLPQLTLMENVLLPAMAPDMKKPDAQQKERAHELIDEVGLSARITHYPGELSTGERQRTAVARALINRPKLILADEPTGSLDSDNSITVLNLLKKLAKEHKSSLLMVTHEKEMASLMDRTIELLDGRIR